MTNMLHYGLNAVFTTIELGSAYVYIPMRLPQYTLIRTMPDNRYYLTKVAIPADTLFLSDGIIDFNIWQDLSIAAGTVTYFAGPRTKVPDGWLIADSATSYDIKKYPALFRTLTFPGMPVGSGMQVVPNLTQGYIEGTTTVQVPNLGSGISPLNGTFSLTASHLPEHGHSVIISSISSAGAHGHSLVNTEATHNSTSSYSVSHSVAGDTSFEGGAGFTWGYVTPNARVGSHYHTMHAAHHQHTMSGVTPAAGQSVPFRVGQPTLRMNVIIKG